MKVKAEVVLREIAGDYVLVPTGETVIDHNGLFCMTEVGARIWELVPECDTEDEIVSKLLEEYDVDEATLRNDVSDFISQLRELDLIF